MGRQTRRLHPQPLTLPSTPTHTPNAAPEQTHTANPGEADTTTHGAHARDTLNRKHEPGPLTGPPCCLPHPTPCAYPQGGARKAHPVAHDAPRGYGNANANGHRRRELIRRVLAEEHNCALCGATVNKTLKYIAGQHGPKCPRNGCTGCAWHPKSPVVDEDIPRIRGGSPLERGNCHLMCRDCNRWKSTMTLAEARAKWSGQTIEAPPIRTQFEW